MPATVSTTAGEKFYEWDDAWKPHNAGLFDIRPPGVPFDATPIYDTDLDCIIGYQKENAGVFRIYSLAGDISVSETPLETPLLDPLDAVFIVGGFARSGVRGLASWGSAHLAPKIQRTALYGLRTRYHALMQRPLRFSEGPLDHMKEPDRFVPVHILRLAVKYGKRVPDPKPKPDADPLNFMYYIDMARLSKYQQTQKYYLEVLVNEGNYVVHHFKYDYLKNLPKNIKLGKRNE